MRVALVTGSAQGIGFAIVKNLLEKGDHKVFGGDIQEQSDEIEGYEENTFIPLKCDLSDSDACRKLVRDIGNVDVLVNNAGASAATLCEDVTDKNWEDDINLKLMSTIRMCRLVITYMKSNNGGVIINATIGGGKAPNAGSLPTTVTRAAGINLTKSLANQYAKDQIRVNTICIGLIKSAQWERRAGSGSIEDFYNELSKKVPMGMVGEEIDYANLVAFLSSKRSSYITGTAINLDGGLCPVV